jgi:MerR family transcriptional regulator, Zn(II)-responsive regulator of zntA
MPGYLRGQIAKKANVNLETLRYYENLGLIPSPSRMESGYRLYSDEALIRLTFIRNAKLCGFTLKEIKKALAKSESGSINLDDFIAAIDKKMESIDEEIATRETKKARLALLKNNLRAADKHPEVLETLRILHMEP